MPSLPRLGARRLFSTLGALAALATGGFAVREHTGAAPPAPGWLQVVSDTDAGLELVLRAPEPERDGARLRLPSFAAGGEPGLPVVYEQAVSIGVPGPAGATLEMLEEARRDCGRVEPEIVPARLSVRRRADEENAGKLSEGLEPQAARSFTAVYPAAAVTLGGVARLRGREVVVLAFRPLQYRPDGGATFLGEVRLRITFRDRARRRDPDAAPAGLEPLHAALLNAATAARWRTSDAGVASGAEARPGLQPGSALPSQRLRIRISKRGIYQLDYATLKSANVPVESLDPRTFRLFFDTWGPLPLYADATPASWQPDYEMQEAAIWAPDKQSFEFDDRLVFYALGWEGYLDLAGASTDSLAYAHHPYDRFLYAWLTWGGPPGLRMPAVDATPPDTLGPVVTRGWHREHREEDLQFGMVPGLWFWQEISPERPASEALDVDLGGETVATGSVRLGFGWGDYSNEHGVDVRLDGRLLGRAWWNGGKTDPEPHFFSYDGVTFGAASKLALRMRTDSLAVANADLLEFDVAWERPLVKSPAGVVDWSVRPVSGSPPVYELRGYGSQAPLLFDVTTAARPVRLVLADSARVGPAGPAARWQARYAGSPGRRTQLLAVAAPIHPAFSDLQMRNVTLRQSATSPDMLIVTHESLRPAAERLAQHRRQHWPGGGSPEIWVVDVQDIYDSFSGGRLDPLAIRNCAKFLYRMQPGKPRLRYLLLFGDATHDPRQLLPNTAPTLVPTVEPRYADGRRSDEVFAVDDWLAEMETPPGSTSFPVPDLAVGRLAARNRTEAEHLVDKIVNYETASGYGAWRTRLILAADDECTPSGCGETMHIEQSELLAHDTPSELDILKMYLTEYTAVLGQKPQARAAFIREWSAGCTLVNYVGHGAPRQLADEQLFLGTDVPSLTNGSLLPLFVAASCTVSEFDDVERQSMCEDMVASQRGGAIASVGATTVTNSFGNSPFNVALVRSMFQNGATSRVPIGIVLQEAKISAGDRQNNQSYVLIGDPSLALLFPAALASFASGADTLHAGRRDSVRVVLGAPADTLRGQADVEVFGSADESGYRRSGLYIPYDLTGAPIYRGTVRIEAGSCKFQFFVPVGVRLGSKGRISVYAWDDRRGLDAKGATGTVDLVRATAEKDTVGPSIGLHFPNHLTHVKAGTPLTAEIRDESGVNIQGTTLRSSIYLDFDRKSEPLNVTSQFRYQEGSASVGQVSVPLPSDLQPGKHSATLIASDNLQNTSTASLDFDVVESAIVRLVNVIAFPNPFRDRTHFFFELTDPAEVEVRVFTTAGREVWHQRQVFAAAAQGSIIWDGVDLLEDRLANGTYIYRLRAKTIRAGSPTLQYTGKVVIMR